jgi:hypothetical protein
MPARTIAQGWTPALDEAQIGPFIERGFVRLDHAFRDGVVVGA